MKRFLSLTLLVFSSSAFAQEGGERLSPPMAADDPFAEFPDEIEITPPVVEDVPPPPTAWTRRDAERPPRPAPPNTRLTWRRTGEEPSFYDPRDELRQRRLAVRLARRAARSNVATRLRVSLLMDAAPRAINGFGPYDDDDRWVYFGVGAKVALQRYVHPFFRFDAEVSAAFVLGDSYLTGNHGLQGTLGGRAFFVTPWSFHTALGIGADITLARERDEAALGHFGWLGARLAVVAEFGWLNTAGRGVTIQISPTFTYAPYDRGLAPGVVFSAGVEFGL